MRFKAIVEISTRKDVLNPEAKAILQALQSLDFPILDLSLNKKFYIDIESKSKNDAFKKLENACKELLANPIIEDYIIAIEDSRALDSKDSKDSKVSKPKKPAKKTATKSQKTRTYKYDDFLDSISDKLKALKYNNDISFDMLANAINTAYNMKISTKALYEYFVRKLEWEKGK